MLPRLIEHLIWADERTAQALDSLPAADSALVRLYAHVLAAEAIWLARLSGLPADVTPWPEHLDGTARAALVQANHSAFREIAGVLDEPAGRRQVSYTNSRGDTFTNTVAEILHHVALHGMYHRGQIMLGIRQAGGTPLPTDFIVFARGS